jgi:HK97 family phage portal protein
MGLFDYLPSFGRRRPVSLNDASRPLTPSLIVESFGRSMTRDTSPDGAMSSGTVYACVRVIAETIASLPLAPYRRTDTGREKLTGSPLDTLLREPNEWQTSYEFWDHTLTQLLLRGNSFTYIERTNGGQPVALIPLNSDQVKVGRIDGRKVYQLTLTNGGTETLADEDVLHILSCPYDGLVGVSPLQYARNAITLALSQEDHGVRFFEQNSTPGGVLEHPGKLTDDAAKRLRESWDKLHSGLKGAHKTAILEEGMSFKPVTIPNEHAQWLQSRQFQVNEIARFYRVPPHMVGDLSRATFSNIEHQSIEFFTNTIRPYLVRIEQQLNRKLVTASDKGDVYVKFSLDGVLRGDRKSRFESYAIGRQQGWLSVDEIRELEELNALPNGEGKVYLSPLNMVPTSKVEPQGGSDVTA